MHAVLPGHRPAGRRGKQSAAQPEPLNRPAPGPGAAPCTTKKSLAVRLTRRWRHEACSALLSGTKRSVWAAGLSPEPSACVRGDGWFERVLMGQVFGPHPDLPGIRLCRLDMSGALIRSSAQQQQQQQGLPGRKEARTARLERRCAHGGWRGSGSTPPGRWLRRRPPGVRCRPHRTAPAGSCRSEPGPQYTEFHKVHARAATQWAVLHGAATAGARSLRSQTGPLLVHCGRLGRAGLHMQPRCPSACPGRVPAEPAGWPGAAALDTVSKSRQLLLTGLERDPDCSSGLHRQRPQ